MKFSVQKGYVVSALLKF